MSQYRNSTLNNAPTTFSYTPTGRAIPQSSPTRTPNRRPSAPSCTPTGRVVLSTPADRGRA